MDVPAKNQEELVIIGIGDLFTGSNPMSSIGLGSCVGLVIHDPIKCIGGMAHVMLPDSGGRTERPGKFADTAVETLVSELIGKGCRLAIMQAKIAGGAAMFKTFSENLNIGERNVNAIRECLKDRKIPIIAEDVGGCTGRTIVYHPTCAGKLMIKLADGTRSEI
ncbi:MAG TPA: chemotaxis protein CheD [Methanoregulaceae archaeon]|nr:chemotaxis protein CheD [Methanoregulaceae archaeon]